MKDIKSVAAINTIIAKKPSHIQSMKSSPDQGTLSGDIGNPVDFTVNLGIDPALVKRAIVMYDAYNVFRSVSIDRKINDSQWSGAALITPATTVPKDKWTGHFEEINPAWLKKGDNTVSFRTINTGMAVKNLYLIIETESGYNNIASCSHPQIYDFDIDTAGSVEIENGSIGIDFENVITPNSVVFFIPEKIKAYGKVFYKSNNEYIELKEGWKIDMNSLHVGWNLVNFPVQVNTDALKIQFFAQDASNKVTSIPIHELRIHSSPIAQNTSPDIIVSYPRDGEFFSRKAFFKGFVKNYSQVDNSFTIEDRAYTMLSDGSFLSDITKDVTRFSTQGNDDSWTAVFKILKNSSVIKENTEYLYKNFDSLPVTDDSSTTDSSSSSSSSSNSSSGTIYNGKTFGIMVYPDQSRIISYRNVTITIPKGAVSKATEITITPLSQSDLPALDPGMINVTAPDAGYRFLPHGVFKKDIEIKFNYSKSKLKEGQVDEEVYMFFYDEKNKRWSKLERTGLDHVNMVVKSKSNHFTDIINGTLSVPEHPNPLSYNPTSIKDIKAGNPKSKINLIKHPKVSNQGDASLSYPIEIPKGRNGVQPQVGLNYSSGGGNGIVGVGWSIPVQSIVCETRWGVPRYDKKNVYLMISIIK